MTLSSFARPLLFGAFMCSLFLTACGGEADLGAHVSSEGLVPEAYIPGDVGTVLSYSLKDEAQYDAVLNLEQKLGDEGRLSRMVAESFNTQFAAAGLDYEKDLMPAFGEQFRWVYGARPKESGDGVDFFSVTTLEDAEQLRLVFDTLSEAGSFEKKALSGREVYVNQEEAFYATVNGDLLLVSGSPEHVLGMLDQEEAESLWTAEHYQRALEEVGQDFVFYGFLFPPLYKQDVPLGGAFSVSNIPSVIERQGIVFRAQEEGLSFDVTVQADEEKAKEAGIAFDVAPKAKPYLFEEVPMEGLMGYFESYGLKETLQQADKLGDDTGTLEGLRESFRNYFGMDFDEELLSWFDKAYVFALHQNDSGLLPGFTIFVDSSSDEESAEEFLNKLDGQILGLSAVLQEALPDAVSHETVEISGVEFTKISVDLTALPRSEESPLPSAVTASEIQLMYGVLDGRVLITTASVWQEEDFESVAESELYSKLKDKVSGSDQGLIVLDAEALADFAGSLRALREQLGLAVSDTALAFEDLLEGFSGAIAQSQTGAYSSSFSGYLLLAD
ncbi:DUF3352 domain-containing protein [Candidatus Peregrinibacteria bacterium]|nr:MAG: DUF3352 domain-containing protein [Candidatus Peregrinibacteria bacterium]